MNCFRIMVIFCAFLLFDSAFCGEETISPEEYQKRKESWILMNVGKTDNMTPEEIEARRKDSEVSFVAIWGDGTFKTLEFKREGYNVRSNYLTGPRGEFVGVIQEDGTVTDDDKIMGHVTEYIPDWKK